MLSNIEGSSLPLPLQDDGEENIKSFKDLAKDLESQLDNVDVTAQHVTKVVSGLRAFQQKHLCKKSDTAAKVGQEWPMLRLPDDLFRDRSVSGPLSKGLLEVYKDAAEVEWDSDDEESKKRKLALLQRMESTLLEMGLLQRPAVYWDDTVNEAVRGELQQIVERFGGATVTDPRHATHVVAHDDEVDLVKEKKEEEEKLYLRTLKKADDMALIHWWYWPSSHDEWMPAEDVAGDSSDAPPRPPGGPWVVCCKFVRDVARYNEWGVEADYAIADYEEKVELYKKSPSKSTSKTQKKKARATRSPTKEKKGEESPVKETDDPQQDAKTQENPVPSTRPSKASTSTPPRAMTPPPSAKRDRRAGEGMNPRLILTGFYGARGERIRHLVHDGALRIAPEALQILQQLEDKYGEDNTSGDGGEDTKQSPSTYELPPIDSVVRPSIDKSLGSIVVTELSTVMQAPPPGSLPDARPIAKTVAVNRRINFKDGPPERIRGGGNGETTKPPGTWPPPVREAASTSTSSSLPPASIPATAPPGSSVNQPGQPPQVSTNVAGGQSFPTARPAAAAQAPSVTSSNPVLPAAHPSQPAATSAAVAPKPVTTSTVPVAAASSAANSSQVKPQASNAPKLVVGLNKRPASQWEQNIPGAHEEVMISSEPPQLKTPKPSWYDAEKVSDFERTMLPEWFDHSAPHRTSASYRKVREQIINMSDQLGNRYVTCTLVRRSIPGDVGSLLRLHGFLVAWGFINDDAINDSAPTGPGLRREGGATWRRQTELGGGKRASSSLLWTDTRRDHLVQAVVEESSKRQKVGDGTATAAFVPIDWDAVAERVGSGVSSAECEEEFLSLPLDSDPMHVERSITPDHAGDSKTPVSSATDSNGTPGEQELKEQVIRQLVEGARPEVIKASTDAALAVTNDLAEAQKASVLGIVASQAAQRAKGEERAIEGLLKDVLEQRVSKIENRLALLDDVEGMLEAERVALELERRDMYTARCRHWFGGGT